MMYYSFMLDDASKDLCTIVAPYGKYKYNRLAMGLKPAPDVTQYYITKTLKDLVAEIYIDDVGIFSILTKNTCKLLQLLSSVCKKLDSRSPH